MYPFSRREEPCWDYPDSPDPMSESQVGSHLNRPIYSLEEVWFQTPVQTVVHHVNVRCMIHISGLALMNTFLAFLSLLLKDNQPFL